MRLKKLHDGERPTSMLASIMVNQGRDPRKSKPVDMTSFYIYEPKDQQNLPSGRYGAAAVELIKRRKFPSWALFCFKELSQSASGEPPALLAYEGVDCLLLAPVATPGGFTGLFIAVESASGEVREMTSPDGQVIKVRVPIVETKIVAEEDVFLGEVS